MIREIGELLDVRLDTGRSTAGILIDSQRSYIGVVVARRVVAMDWAIGPFGSRTVGRRWNRDIGTFSCAPTPQRQLRLDLTVESDAALSITAAEFAFYAVHVAGLPDAPPDYTELDDSAIHQQRPDWSSPCEVLWSSHRTV